MLAKKLERGRSFTVTKAELTYQVKRQVIDKEQLAKKQKILRRRIFSGNDKHMRLLRTEHIKSLPMTLIFACQIHIAFFEQFYVYFFLLCYLPIFFLFWSTIIYFLPSIYQQVLIINQNSQKFLLLFTVII